MAISATELRIGNLFNPDAPTMVEAWMLLPDSKIVFEPIPLTEEWLVKFWFRNEIGIFILISELPNSRFFIHYNNGVFAFAFGEKQNQIIEVKYIHSLQNLYKAITGKELQLKE